MTSESLLKQVEKQLEKWALESTGEHVKPMIKLIWEIKRHLHGAKRGDFKLEAETETEETKETQ